MMKKSIGILSVLCIASVAMGDSIVPVVFPTPVGPGNQTPLFNPTNENPVDYGITGFNFGWTYDGFQGFNAGGVNALIRMAPSLQGPGAFAAMQENVDYGFHFEFQMTGAVPAGSDIMMFSKHSPPDIGQPADGREDRMFSIWYTSGTTDGFSVRVGDNAGGWTIVAQNLSAPLGEYIDFDVHYDASAPEFEFYWDGTPIGSAQTGHGRYDLDFWQIEEIVSGGPTITHIRNVRLGHIPEPGTLALLALGGLALALRRRS